MSIYSHVRYPRVIVEEKKTSKTERSRRDCGLTYMRTQHDGRDLGFGFGRHLDIPVILSDCVRAIQRSKVSNNFAILHMVSFEE